MFGLWEAVLIAVAAFAFGWICGRLRGPEPKPLPEPEQPGSVTDAQRDYIMALCRRLDRKPPADLDRLSLDSASDLIDSLKLELDPEPI